MRLSDVLAASAPVDQSTGLDTERMFYELVVVGTRQGVPADIPPERRPVNQECLPRRSHCAALHTPT
jgi:hypothetical protein